MKPIRRLHSSVMRERTGGRFGCGESRWGRANDPVGGMAAPRRPRSRRHRHTALSTKSGYRSVSPEPAAGAWRAESARDSFVTRIRGQVETGDLGGDGQVFGEVEILDAH